MIIIITSASLEKKEKKKLQRGSRSKPQFSSLFSSSSFSSSSYFSLIATLSSELNTIHHSTVQNGMEWNR